MAPEQLKNQIEQEAEDYANKEADPTYTHLEAHNRYMKRHYIQIATAYATRAITAEAENDRLRKALTKIANWELPETGKFWDEKEKRPMSYEAAYGSNGVRDYMKALAKNALTPKPTTNE